MTRLHLTFITFLTFIALGCTKSEADKEYSVFTIEADKTEVEANGKEMVRFKVIADDGTVLSETQRKSVRIKEVNGGGMTNPGIFTRASIWNKEEEFVAVYKNIQSTNSVKVKFHNREKYEKYHQNIVIINVRATWCVFCPAMINALDGIQEKYKDHLILVGLHSGTDPFLPLTNPDLGSSVLAKYNSSGIPTCIYDLYEVNNTRNSDEMGAMIHNYLTEHPATTGIKIESSAFEDGVLRFRTAVTSTADDKYSISWAILSDWNQYSGGTLSKGVYNNVVEATSNNFHYMSSSSTFSMKAGEEVIKEFEAEIPGEIDQAHARLVVMVSKRSDNKQEIIIDNAAQCALGSGVDYRLN